MDNQGEPHTAASSRPFEHLLIAVGVAERHDRAAPNERVNPFRFARPIIDEEDLRLAQELRLSTRGELIFRDCRRTYYLLRRNAVALVGEDAHELHAAAGDDKGLEAVSAQIGE